MRIVDLGGKDYKSTWDLQREIFEGVVSSSEDDTLLLVEHPPVYTLGRVTEQTNVLFTPEKLQELGAESFEIDRGGDVTFHGPGQLVGYPILNLSHYKEDLGWYLRTLEQTIIELLATYNLHAFAISGRTGVWVGAPSKERKICAIGIRCSRWCTMHGFAFNVSTDLSYFDHIVPCGIQDRSVTSLEKELKQEVSLEEVKGRYIEVFQKYFVEKEGDLVA